MAWQQVDLGGRLWTLPREATKTDRARDVPLSPLALDVLGRLARLAGPLVFSNVGVPRRGVGELPESSAPPRPPRVWRGARLGDEAVIVELR
jgi:integrase